MAESTFRLNLYSPDKLIYGDDVQSTVAHGSDGYLGILPRHAPLLTSLEIGALSVTDKDGKEQKFALIGGFLEVINNEVTILAETAEHIDDIDIKRAKAAKDRAQNRLDERSPEVDRERAEFALKKAITRLKLKGA